MNDERFKIKMEIKQIKSNKLKNILKLEMKKKLHLAKLNEVELSYILKLCKVWTCTAKAVYNK